MPEHDGGLYRVQSAVSADVAGNGDVMVPLQGTVIGQEPDRSGELRIVGCDQSAVTGTAQELGRVEARGAQSSLGAGAVTQALGGVQHHGEFHRL